MRRKHQWILNMTTDEFIRMIKNYGISNNCIVLGEYGWVEVRKYNSYLGGRAQNSDNTNSLYLRISPHQNGIKVRGVFGLPAPFILAGWIPLLGFLLFYISNAVSAIDVFIFVALAFLPLCIVLLLFKRAVEHGIRNRNETDNQALIHLIDSICNANINSKDESAK